MAHLDYSQGFEEGRTDAFFGAMARLTRDWWRARRRHFAEITAHYEQRDAFNALLGKEDWVLDDMGISRADVEYLSRLPMHMNAAAELEKVRARSMMGR
ncbi:MAG: hypothetical protein AAFR13_00325 [Pseudomonadota bacterium]